MSRLLCILLLIFILIAIVNTGKKNRLKEKRDLDAVDEDKKSRKERRREKKKEKKQDAFLGMARKLKTGRGKGGNFKPPRADRPVPKRLRDGNFSCKFKERKLKFFESCIENGYHSVIESCQYKNKILAFDESRSKRCRKLDLKLQFCEHECETESESMPDALNSSSLVEQTRGKEEEEEFGQCVRRNVNFPGAEIFHKVCPTMVECIQCCRQSRGCKAVSYRSSDRQCSMKNKEGGAAGPQNAFGYLSLNLECDKSEMNNMECLREVQDFTGSTLASLYVSGIEQCVSLCRDTDECVAISYDTAERECHLKFERGGGAGPRIDPGYQSMNMECENGEVRNLGCLREGVLFQGADLSDAEVGDISDCVKLCRDTDACSALSYREKDKRCFLKNRRGGVGGPSVDSRYSSLNMRCESHVELDRSCLREGYNFPGADLAHLVTVNEEECVNHCKDTEQCTAISYRLTDKKCFLKSMRGGSTGPMLARGVNSMNMECDNTAVNNAQCLREGVFFSGADLRYLMVRDEAECVRHCLDTELCVAVSWSNTLGPKACYLKSRRGGSRGPSHSSGYSSMNMECDSSMVENLDCMRQDVYFPGADLKNLMVESEAECVQHCRDTLLCTALSYRLSDKRCYLKSRRGGSAGPTVTAGFKSMNLECQNTQDTNLDCFREGVYFPGADMRYLIVSDEGECVRHCQDTESCVAVSFRDSFKGCYLKSKRGGDSGPTFLSGYRSMNLLCRNEGVSNECVRENVVFPGRDIRALVLDDIDSCVKVCSDTHDCLAVSYSTSDSRCHLKGSDFDWWQEQSKENYSSVNLSCT